MDVVGVARVAGAEQFDELASDPAERVVDRPQLRGITRRGRAGEVDGEAGAVGARPIVVGAGHMGAGEGGRHPVRQAGGDDEPAERLDLQRFAQVTVTPCRYSRG